MMVSTYNDILALPVRNFASLMELYENNYIFMRRLMPELDRLPERMVSRVPGAVDLRLEVLERCRYTTMLALTHTFEAVSGGGTSPDLEVRIYHDARTAEALANRGLNRIGIWQRQPQPDPNSLAWRWEVNRFLFRWLRYCLAEGHRFMPSPAR
jgi:uncharacterized protein YqiB (DUF1249 family)